MPDQDVRSGQLDNACKLDGEVAFVSPTKGSNHWLGPFVFPRGWVRGTQRVGPEAGKVRPTMASARCPVLHRRFHLRMVPQAHPLRSPATASTRPVARSHHCPGRWWSSHRTVEPSAHAPWLQRPQRERATTQARPETNSKTQYTSCSASKPTLKHSTARKTSRNHAVF